MQGHLKALKIDRYAGSDRYTKKDVRLKAKLVCDIHDNTIGALEQTENLPYSKAATDRESTVRTRKSVRTTVRKCVLRDPATAPLCSRAGHHNIDKTHEAVVSIFMGDDSSSSWVFQAFTPACKLRPDLFRKEINRILRDTRSMHRFMHMYKPTPHPPLKAARMRIPRVLYKMAKNHCRLFWFLVFITIFQTFIFNHPTLRLICYNLVQDLVWVSKSVVTSIFSHASLPPISASDTDVLYTCLKLIARQTFHHLLERYCCDI